MKDTCNVTNRSASSVVYKIQDPDCMVRRVFNIGETHKNVKVSELERLLQQPGGKDLFVNYLAIDDEEIALYLINGEIPLEYWFTEQKLPSWMNNCSLDEFKDALDFAPDGVKDMIKKFAVSMPLNDLSKIGAIKEQLGYDVSVAIKNSEPEQPKVETKPATRRATPVKVERRVSVGEKK